MYKHYYEGSTVSCICCCNDGCELDGKKNTMQRALQPSIRNSNKPLLKRMAKGEGRETYGVYI